MSEIIFIVQPALEGGYLARSLGESIFVEADTEPDLQMAIQEAVSCHFTAETMPKIIRTRFEADKSMSAQLNRSSRSKIY